MLVVKRAVVSRTCNWEVSIGSTQDKYKPRGHYGPTQSWAYADTHPYPYPYPYPYPMYGYGYMDMDMDMDMDVYPHRPNSELARNVP